MSREKSNSNIYYLGYIPFNWNVQKYKSFADTRMGETILASNTYKNGIPVYSATQEDKIFGYVNECNIKLKKGDLVIPARGNSIGCVSMIKEDVATCTQTTICSYNIRNINPKFLYFSILGLNNEWYKYDGSAIPQITVEQVKNCYLAVPPLSEQDMIVNYLDNKVSKINQTIEDNKKEIELLEEYKKNYYNEMLNILNKTAIKNVVIDVKDGTHATISRKDEGEYLLSSKNIQDNKLYIGENESMISVDDYNLIVKNGYPQKNDILFCSVGTVGKTCIYNYDKPMAFQRSVSFLRTNEKMLPKFLYYNTKTIFFEDDLLKNVNKALQDGIYINQIKNLKVSYCNIEKQKKFIHLLDIKTDKLNKVISYRKLIITKLKEYKKSLIYEAVTGKIEV